MAQTKLSGLLIRSGSIPISAISGSLFPFNGAAQITGSLGVTGSANGNVLALSIASATASMNMEAGNFFTLLLSSGSTTHLTTSNVTSGQTVSLLIQQPTVGTGSLSFASAFRFPSSSRYTASPTTSSQDIITCITFNTSSIYATSVTNLI